MSQIEPPDPTPTASLGPVDPGRWHASCRTVAALAAVVAVATGCSARDRAPAPSTTSAPTTSTVFRTPAELVDALDKAAASARTVGVDGTITSPTTGRLAFRGDTGVAESAERDVHLTTPHDHLELITVDKVTYVVDDNNYWHRIAEAQIRPLATLFTPAGQISILRGGARGLVSHGRETVDMHVTNHYSVMVDASAAMAARGRPHTRGLPASTTWEIWMDEDNLLRRVRYTLGDVSVVANYDAWGEPGLDLSPPEPAQVVDDRPPWLRDLPT